MIKNYPQKRHMNQDADFHGRLFSIIMRFTKEGRIYAFLVITILITYLSACGYHFAGRGQGLPSDIKTIAVPFFTNKTFEPRIENIFTNTLIAEFLKRGMVKIGKREESDATLTGTIKSFKISPISFDKNDRILEYRATLTVDISLKRNDDGTIIREFSDVSGDYEYKVSSNTTATYSNKREAIKSAAEYLSEVIHNRIFENF